MVLRHVKSSQAKAYKALKAIKSTAAAPGHRLIGPIKGTATASNVLIAPYIALWQFLFCYIAKYFGHLGLL